MKNKVLKYKKNPLIIAITLNLFFIVICFLFFHMRYETNDDIAMKTILNGAYGELSSFTYFSNIFLGYFLKSLYSITGNIDWYFLFQTGITFISLTSICFSFLKLGKISLKSKGIGVILSIILLIVAGADLYLFVNFTKTAGIASIAGFVMLINYVKGYSHNIITFILGNSLLLIGGFIRFESMLLVGLFFFIIFCVELPKCFKQHTFIKYVKEYIYTFGPILIILLFAIIANYNYDLDYRNFNAARSSLVDKGFIDYDKHAQQYENINVSANDIAMISDWSFDDPLFFTKEKLEEIAEVNNTSVSFKDNVRESFEYIMISFNYTVGIVAILIMFVYSFYVRKGLIYILTIAFVWLVYFYFSWFGRTIYRCEYVIWLSVFIVFGYQLLENANIVCSENRKKISILALVVFLSLNLYYPFFKSKSITPVNSVQNSKLLQLLKKDTENLYLFDTITLGSVSFGNEFDMYKTYQKGENINILSLGSWLTNHPVNKYALSHYDIENPLKDLVDNEKVYVVDSSHINTKTQYLQEHYYENLLIRKVRSLNGISIYQYFTKAFDFSDKTLINSEYTFNDIKISKDIDNTYVQGKIFLSNEKAWNSNICIEIYDTDEDIIYSDIATLYFDEDMNFSEIEFSIDNSIISEISKYHYRVYLESDKKLELLGDFELN